MGQQGKVLFKGILNSRGRTEGQEATHTSNTLLIAAKLLMRFDDNISLSYLNLGPKAVFGFNMGLMLSCSDWWCVGRVNPLGTHGNGLTESFLSFIVYLSHSHTLLQKRKIVTFCLKERGWSVGKRQTYSSERTNVINGACWARLAWDWSSCNVCHRAINSLDRASQKLQKVRGPGSGPQLAIKPWKSLGKLLTEGLRKFIRC